jgi:hypothetical protein
MTIIEAIKSGKKFKREICERWLLETKNSAILFSVGDILADDWEIEEPRIEITRTQFFQASEQTRKAFLAGSSGRDIEHFTLLFAEHLGFKS